MTTPPSFPNADQSAASPVPISIRLGNEDGDAPESGDIVEHLRLLSISRSLGGRELDRAIFAYDLDKTGQRLEDLQTLTGWNRQIEVRAFGDTGSEDGDVLFWGDLTGCKIAIDPNGEFATIEAVLAPYLFGEMITGQKVRDPLEDDRTVVQLDEDLVFNPLIDGQIVSNRSTWLDEDGKFRFFVDPESVRSATARDFSEVGEGELDLWELDEALRTLQGAFNGDEEFVTNFDAIDNAIFEDAEPLKNVRIRRGQYLPTALDSLLQPLGFNWFVDVTLEDTADPGDGSDHEPVWEIKKSIVVIKRGEGVEKQLYFQKPGEEYEATKSNVPEVGVDWDVADLANEVIIHGALQEAEVSLEIYRGWNPAHDTLTADDLDKSDPDSQYYTTPNAHDVHRLWVANEAGDLNGFREEIPDPPDLRDVFTDYVPKRRRMYDCLTFTSETERQRRPVFLEWWNPENIATEKWEPVPAEWGFTVLSEQIGIRFTGSLATGPAPLIELGDDARLRITGTLIGDSRISRSSVTTGVSPNSRDVALFIDASDRFHDRRRRNTGTYKSRFSGSVYPADEAIDAGEMQDFANQLSDIEESAAMDAKLGLFGMHFDYGLGDLITEIEGRGISLNRNSPDSAEKKYLQVTGIVWDYQKQQTILRVEAEEAFA